MTPDFAIRPVVAGKQDISIISLLHWAFARECAQLDFDEVASTSGGGRVATDTIWRMMQTKNLGCRVDGGGRSEPHPDADMVASAVASLPEGLGGRRMAVEIADMARAAIVPSWHRVDASRYYPAETESNQHGARCKSKDAAELGVAGWPRQARVNRLGRKVTEVVRYTPVVVRPTGAEIAASHRRYLRWYGALLELRATFQGYGGLPCNLSCWTVTDAMPCAAPWKKVVDEL